MTQTCYIAAYETLSDGYLKDFMSLLKKLDWEYCSSLSKSPDIILYPGGSDLSPQTYGQKPLETTDKVNLYRDGAFIQAYEYSQLIAEHSVWNVGICLGMQFLNVMNGGKLQQHVEGHQDSEKHIQHQVEYFGKNKKDTYGTLVNSYHHQMILPPTNGKQKHSPYTVLVKTLGLLNDPEAILFPKTQSVGVQWHPEWDEEGSFKLFKRIMDDYVKEAA